MIGHGTPGFTAGTTYGNIYIVRTDHTKRLMRYLCRCLLCGNEYLRGYQSIKLQKLEYYGCPECAKKKKTEEHIRTLTEEYVGKKFGSLEIQSIVMKPYKGRNNAFAVCLCHACGQTVEILLTRITKSGVKTCTCQQGKILKEGREKLHSEYHLEGTCIAAINQNISKNSSTGHKGVSYHQKTHKYRAYLTFQRKQYNLGLYENLDDAIAARKEGEERIFGAFLEKYREEKKEEGEGKQGDE